MSVRDTILTINVVEPGLVRAVNLHAKQKGIKLKGLVLTDKAYAEEAPDRPADNTGLFTEIICDFNDANELQKVLKPYHDRLLLVTCRSEAAVQPLRQVIPFLPYIHTPSETALLWSTEKPLMRDRLSNYDESLTPRYQHIDEKNIKQVDELTKDFSFPVIVKPGGLAESLLVSRCEDRAEMNATLTNTFQLIRDIYAREHRRGAPSVLVEEMMQGDMFSTDAYVTPDGRIFCLPLVKVITAHAIGLPGFYSYRHIIPVELPAKEIEAAFTTARSAIKALNLSATSTHIELFQTPQGWKIIEVGARIGGYREPLYGEAYGVDHYFNDLAVRMGEDPVMPGDPIRHAAGVNIYADEEGIIETIEGIEEARELGSVVFVDAYAKTGDMALFASNGGKLIVDGILSNEDPEQLEKDVAKVRELVKIHVRKK